MRPAFRSIVVNSTPQVVKFHPQDKTTCNKFLIARLARLSCFQPELLIFAIFGRTSDQFLQKHIPQLGPCPKGSFGLVKCLRDLSA